MKKVFMKICVSSALLASISSCQPDAPPPKDKKLNWEDGAKAVNVRCQNPGNECSIDYQDLRGTTPYYNEFLSYYRNNRVIEYFSSDERWMQLFPQYRIEYAHLRQGVLNGSVRIFVSASHTIVFYQNQLNPQNVLHAFQF
jgi:hypothetical protein